MPLDLSAKKYRRFFRPPISLLLISLLLLIIHIISEQNLHTFLTPESVYKYTLSMSFESDGDVTVSTYLPDNDDRLEILDETISSPNFDIEHPNNVGGRYTQWSGSEGNETISYSALLSLKDIQFELSSHIEIPTLYERWLTPYLKETAAIPIAHPEIQTLWTQIKPANQTNTLDVLQSIYTYTHQKINSLPFKGFTDSLTALRLGAASCNGKSRLFVSLARLNNLPSRLVGGVILNGEKKKTSHQWVEVYIEDYWVPFDPTNGHFARLPRHYVALYRGDYQLFKHTSNINFDYSFNSYKGDISPALYRDTSSPDTLIPNAAALLKTLGLPLQTSYIFLLFPICTLLITFLRNIVGLKTFGIFMPMLIAAASVYTGFWVGLIGFTTVLLLAFISHVILGKLNILKIPRLASIITITTIASLIGMSSIAIPQNFEFGLLALFPVVIISFAADRIHQMTNESSWPELAQNAVGTLITLFLCYLIFTSFLLQGLFALYPELLLTVLALQISIGSWSGMRISEIIRFRRLMGHGKKQVLSINGRNRDLIYKHNSETLLKLATNKLETKKCLSLNNVPCPATIASCYEFGDIAAFMQQLDKQADIVIKPNKGARGNGILLLAKKQHDGFISTSGKSWPSKAIKQHIEEILSGSFSQNGDEDAAYIEPMIHQHHTLKSFAPLGLCDIRIIVCNGKLLSAMLRIPTLKSKGKANLHKGAIGTSIDLKTGRTGRSLMGRQIIHNHPDSNKSLQNIQLPYWNDIKNMAEQCYQSIPLGYMGVDICIDEKEGPLVLEVNGRPGLEIQNVNDEGIHNTVLGAF
jgi:alpha-L-glutamate ligase-like protein